jgi:hypothetical protein
MGRKGSEELLGLAGELDAVRQLRLTAGGILIVRA